MTRKSVKYNVIMLSLQHDGGQKIVQFLAITHPISESGWAWNTSGFNITFGDHHSWYKQKGYEQATKVKY